MRFVFITIAKISANEWNIKIKTQVFNFVFPSVAYLTKVTQSFLVKEKFL